MCVSPLPPFGSSLSLSLSRLSPVAFLPPSPIPNRDIRHVCRRRTMSAIQQVQDPHPTKARNYGATQTEIYKAGMFHNILPTLTTDPNKLADQARRTMNQSSYAYVAGGAGERATMDANRLAFRQWKAICNPAPSDRPCGRRTRKLADRDL